jgi:hypothetical protein
MNVASTLSASSLASAMTTTTPLCGYWVWEHTPTKHQIKMHLAKNTDRALHCLLAIITNQVDVEKKSMMS